MNCIFLPVNKSISFNPPQFTRDCICKTISSTIGIACDKIVLLRRHDEEKRMIPILESRDLTKTVYVLLRLGAGGKGGFRKQLEKKGREFARAKRKEKKSIKKNSSEPLELTNPDNKKTRPIKRKYKVVKKESVSSISSGRDLARQGVEAAFRNIDELFDVAPTRSTGNGV